MSSTGVYTPSTACSGHGECEPDPWLPYAGVCKCYRGYEFRDCSVLSTGGGKYIMYIFFKNEDFERNSFLFFFSTFFFIYLQPVLTSFFYYFFLFH